MKASDMTLFLVCLGLGVFIAGSLGIGGTQFQGMSFWESITSSGVNIENQFFNIHISFLAMGITILFGCIIAALILGEIPFTAGAPLSIQGIGLILYAAICGAIFAGAAAFFFSLPYGLGAWVGTAFSLFATIILLVDVSEKMSKKSG